MNQVCCLATAGLIALLLAPAVAQTPSVAPGDAATKTIITVPSGALQRVQNAWRGRRLIGTPVFADNGEQLAIVSDLLITDSGAVEKVVLSVTLRRRLVAVPFSQLRFVPSQRTGMHAGRRGTRFETAAAGPFGILLPGATRDTLAALETFRFVSSP
jgi:hypothetical protein